MTECIPDVKPMKGNVIPEVKPCLSKRLNREEQDKVERALDNIGAVFYSVYFGYPLRSVETLNKELKEAKQLLAEIKCPEVI